MWMRIRSNDREADVKSSQIKTNDRLIERLQIKKLRGRQNSHR